MPEDFVYMPVPSRWATAVHRYLADLADDEPEPPREAKPLTPELVRRMYNESLDKHRRLMTYMANRPDEWISTADLAKALSMNSGARGMAGLLGAFGRRAKHRYGRRTPWESRWDEGREISFHRMPEEVAGVIRELR